MHGYGPMKKLKSSPPNLPRASVITPCVGPSPPPLLNPSWKDLKGRKLEPVAGFSPAVPFDEKTLQDIAPHVRSDRFTIITDRNNLKKLFGAQQGEFSVGVSRFPNIFHDKEVVVLSIEHKKNGCFIPDVERNETNNLHEPFANAFEKLLTSSPGNAWKEDTSFVRITRWSLEDSKFDFFLRCEIDCFLDQGALGAVEAKLKHVDAPDKFWTWYWPFLQMWFADAKTLILGRWKEVVETKERVLSDIISQSLDEIWNPKWSNVVSLGMENLAVVFRELRLILSRAVVPEGEVALHLVGTANYSKLEKLSVEDNQGKTIKNVPVFKN